MKNKIILTFLFVSISIGVNAQRISVEEYIEQFKVIAMDEMKRSGVPASITLAQGILESESGNSELVKRSNNHFGIKCKSNWSGESVSHDDDAAGECFRAYTNADESYRDHSDFLRVNKRYSALFALEQDDYAGWAKGLKKAGYATNPRYPDLLIKYIEQYNLQQFSLAVLNKLPQMDLVKQDVGLERELPNEISSDGKHAALSNKTSESEDFKLSSINKTKCIFAGKGTSLLVIANQYNISLNKLMEFNDLSEDGIIEKDQYLFLHKKSKTGEKDYHVVQPGESLFDIAQKNGIQMKYLLEYNNLEKGSKLKANSQLNLQPVLSTENRKSIDKKPTVHYVAPKEGLYAIAKLYKVTVQQLRDWNQLQSDELKIGQEIIVTR